MAFLKSSSLVLNHDTALKQHFFFFFKLLTGDTAVLILLDLTAAFDTVDHQIILSRLKLCVGIKGTALKLFQSSERTFNTHLGKYSSSAALGCGVPQGPILGPVLFSICSIFGKYNIAIAPSIVLQMIYKSICQ